MLILAGTFEAYGWDVHQHQQGASFWLISRRSASSFSASSWKRSVKEQINPAALPSYSTSSTLSPGNHTVRQTLNYQTKRLQLLLLTYYPSINECERIPMTTGQKYTPLTLVLAWTNIFRASFLSSTVSRRRKKLWAPVSLTVE